MDFPLFRDQICTHLESDLLTDAQRVEYLPKFVTGEALETEAAHSMGSRVGTVVRALAFHQCGPGLIPGLGVICGLSLLLVLCSAPRGFSPGTPVFPSPQKPTLSKFQFDSDTVDDKSHYVDVHC